MTDFDPDTRDAGKCGYIGDGRERWQREADDPDDVWLRIFPDRDEPLGGRPAASRAAHSRPMNTPRRVQLLNSFALAAKDAGAYSDPLCRQAAKIAWKIDLPGEPAEIDDREIWLELEDRLKDIGHEAGWMRAYGPDFHPDEYGD